MKSSKSLYSKYFQEYKLNDDTLKRLQEELLTIFIDVKKICDEHNIKYMMSGGSCLGTIRHKGFIPWDDDIDIMMTRTEYEKFVIEFKKKYSKKYYLAEPLNSENYFCKMPKIYKKGTTLIEIPNVGINGPNMIFLDIFIIENVPNSKLKRKILGKYYDFCFKGASTCIDYLYPSPVIREKAKTNIEIKKYYKLRRTIGFFFSHIGGINHWLRQCNKIEKKYKNKLTNKMGIPSAISYEKEIFDKRVFLETQEALFCGLVVNIPKEYDLYLTNLYGNYMEIPQKEKREMHMAYKIEFNEKERKKK